MKKKNYTLEQIKEGLRLCESDENFDNCVDCPFRFVAFPECEKLLMRLARKTIILYEKQNIFLKKKNDNKKDGPTL